MIRRLRQKIRQWSRRDQIEADLQEEMRFHLEMKAAQQAGAGLPPAVAEQAARRAFGNTVHAHEDSLAQWEFGSFDTWLRDIRYGLRGLRRSPGFTMVAVLALALGIGANSAIFSVANAVLFRPLAYGDPERLVTVLHFGRRPVAPANYLDWREQAQSFEAMGAAQAWGPSYTGADRTSLLKGIQLSANMFDVLGVKPLLGRTFTSQEDQPTAAPVAVLSYGLWQRLFGGDPGIVGRQITLEGKAHTVVGVMPQTFHFAPFWSTNSEIWSPLQLRDRVTDRGGQSLRIFARLKPGTSVKQAQAEMDTISARLSQQYPKNNAKLTAGVVPLHEKVVGNIRPLLLVLLGAVFFVLLAACANVGNLLLARAAARQKEMALRVALGAGRGRLLRQLLTESALLAMFGGALGLWLAYGGVKAIEAALPPGSLPRQEELGLDRATLWFTIALALTTGLVAGLIPAWQVTRTGVQDTLKESGRSATGTRRQHRVRRGLVAVEVALAVVLLFGAGVMLRSFGRLMAVDPGFDPSHLLTMTVSVANSPESDPARRSLFYDDLSRRLAALPGVRSVGAINHLPLAGDTWRLSVTVEGRPLTAPNEGPSAIYRVVRPGYFETMHIRMREGRDFSDNDRLGTPGAVIINETFANRLWPGESPLGKRIRLSAPEAISSAGGEWLTVVGVVKNAKQDEWASAPEEEMYLAYAQSKDYTTRPEAHYAYLSFIIRTTGDPAAMAGAAQAEVWALDRNLPVSEVTTMEKVIWSQMWRARVSLMILGLFAAVAITLAATGIYGVLSQSVAQRTHELGIRAALGAQHWQLLLISFRDGMAPVTLGLAVGTVLSLLAARSLRTLLYEVTPTDPLTFCAVLSLLLTVALIANYVPVRRALRTDPVLALRYES